MTDPKPKGAIAITGMAARLPGATTVDAYWDLLRSGRCAIETLTEDECRAAGVPDHLLARPDYVRACAPLTGYKGFDGEFFGFSPRESAILDPQHRQFLETAWEALESAGVTPEGFDGKIGVYGGCGMGSYFYFNLCSNTPLVDDVGMFLLRHTGNDKDFLTTRVSQIFDLTGPSVGVQTACSTSLVATHMGVEALRDGKADMVLAGGVTIELPQKHGYVYKEGEVLSPDGLCHAFDHRAQGTVFGSGAAVIALRRLEDALADGDPIWAVIRGAAINNDGAAKAGYLAPSVEGQAQAASAAYRDAGVSARDIGYVECHGTGTYLGDPIEVAALTQAFRETTEDDGFCRIGSVKTNIGHLDTAAGAASLIKAALALHHEAMPPSLGYDAPNPAIDFDDSPFAVNAALTDWPRAETPRRAAVNSLGVGGTNAHVVLEEAPSRAPSEPGDWPFALLMVSGRTAGALDGNTERLTEHLRAHPEQPLEDVAWTLHKGRRAFERRRVVVAETHAEAAELLARGDKHRVFTHRVAGDAPEAVFMFPGGGAQYAGMGRDLYETEPEFRDWMDRGLDHLATLVDYDPRAAWLSGDTATLLRPAVQLPLICITEVALARLWMSWGIVPGQLIGHSMGENAAACVAGVIGFEDCIGLVTLRGQLMEQVEKGGMLGVPLAPAALEADLAAIGGLALACRNAPELSVVSGPKAALAALEERLRAREIEVQPIAIDIAAHSQLLDPVLDRFRAFLAGLRLQAPQIPVISNRTGAPLTPAQATSPDYWTEHLRHAVLFAEGMAHLQTNPERVYIEVGPGRAMSALAQANGVAAHQVVNTLRHPDHAVADDLYFLTALGRSWATGLTPDWTQYWGDARRQKVVLPSYAFQHQDYFIEPRAPQAEDLETRAPIARMDDMEDWGWAPHWRKSVAPGETDPRAQPAGRAAQTVLAFTDAGGAAHGALATLESLGHRVVRVRADLGTPDGFAPDGPDRFRIAPDAGRPAYDALVATLRAEGLAPDRIAHFWALTPPAGPPGPETTARAQELGFASLLHLAQALGGEEMLADLPLTVFTHGAQKVGDAPLTRPEMATLAGPVLVIPREFAGVEAGWIDLDPTQPPDTDAMAEELLADPWSGQAAHRGTQRFTLEHRPLPLPARADAPFRDGGTYLITGGFGGIGLSLAQSLVERHKANLILMGRGAVPARAEWDAHLRARGPFDATSERIAALRAFEEAGARVLPVSGDAAVPEEVLTALRDGARLFGKVDGIIHAAGVVDDAPLMTRTPAEVDRVMAPKLRGTQVLAAQAAEVGVDWLMLCASTSTALGPQGQVDYVAANAWLNAFAQSRIGQPGPHVVAINWGPWRDVGMAADVLERAADQPVTASLPGPVLTERAFLPDGRIRFSGTLDTARDWVVGGHRTKDGAALLPGTGTLDLLAQAMGHLGASDGLEIADLIFERPLFVKDGTAKAIRLLLSPTEEGFDAELQCDETGDGGWAVTARARLHSGTPEPLPPLDPAALAARCGAPERAPDGDYLSAAQERHLRFGPEWHVLRSTRLGAGEGVADLALAPDLSDAVALHPLHPGLLDIATGWAMDLIPGYAGRNLWVPLTYESLRLHHPLPARLLSAVRLLDASGGVARFDVVLAAPDGTICAEVRGFSVTRLEGTAIHPEVTDPAQLLRDPAEAATAPEEPAGPPTTPQERLRDTVARGIRPPEGAEAFARAMASGTAQLYVTPLPLDRLVAQARSEGPQAADEGEDRFARPEMDADYVAPRTPVEERLTTFWQELLGIDGIGVKDDFFDLGGHSLVAVRLFARIRKEWGVDLPISTLFDAPTVETVAALIGPQDVPDTAQPDEAPEADAPAPRRHVVAMQDAPRGTPFFCVAGMFGNVMNLRYLAALVGQDRPVYGLQARGVLPGDTPHESFEDAARDYIAELRQVQPEGPYLLGGYSGGGLIALEMAQQLERAGQDVGIVLMLDTPLPVRPTITRGDKLQIKLQQAREEGPLFLARWARDRLRAKLGGGQAHAPGDDAVYHDTRIEAAFHTARYRYQVSPWAGAVTLLRPPIDARWRGVGGRAISHEREYLLADNGWSDLLSGLEIVETPGDHLSMVLEPNVRRLAAEMRAALARAESAGARAGRIWPWAAPERRASVQTPAPDKQPQTAQTAE